MHIAIDARFWGLHNTGLGRYTMRLVTELLKLDQTNQYTLIINPQSQSHIEAEICDVPNSNYQLHPLSARHYSFAEQLHLPRALTQINPDLYHVPHFNIPIFWSGPLIVTIHDLIKQASVGAETTTLPMPLYWAKYHIHNLVIDQAVHRSRAIIVPSQYTKQQLLQKYPRVGDSKIHITPEAPDPIYFQASPTSPQLYELPPHQYLIYTGNAYPHKNLPNLLHALKLYNQSAPTPLHLAIVCARNIFQSRLESLVQDLQLEHTVHFLGFIPDDQLRDLYRHSLAFITPSLIEGFGLPGLEAMAAGTLVLSSHTSSLPEIYGSHAIYFDPHNPQDILEKIHQTMQLTKSAQQDQIQAGITHARTYSWSHMATQTLAVYSQTLTVQKNRLLSKQSA